MALNEIGPSSRERLTTLAKSIGREEFAMNVLEIPDEKVLDMLADELARLYDMRSVNENMDPEAHSPPGPLGESMLEELAEVRLCCGKCNSCCREDGW